MKELQNPSAFDAYQRFDTKVKCPTGHNFGSNSPLYGDTSQMPGVCPMGGGGKAVLELAATIYMNRT